MNFHERKALAAPSPAHRRYVISAIHPAWNREPNSPFASFTITYSDPSAAHEKCLWLKGQGFHNVTITPEDS